MKQFYDVIVVGGGHAGCEAAMAAARLGVSVLLLTHNIETIGQMSCNPAIGGIGKGHLVKEIDALGGIMARAIDKAGIQFRTLNARKGPAVRATRAQADRQLYKAEIRRLIENEPNVYLFQQAVDDLIIEQDTVTGVITQMGVTFKAKTVVLTVGTFLGGKIHIGQQQSAGGRAGDMPANILAQKLRERPFAVGRLKTGTPPRIDARTVDFSKMTVQPGDQPLPVFSFMGNVAQHPQQVPCHITYTNQRTHEIIEQGLPESAMYSGNIEGIGPRYCPSIEDKVVRFAQRDAHQIFVEPEGLSTYELYPNGVSTSLPFRAQIEFIQSIAGFEQAHITRAGYAIEYDYFDPRELKKSLETKHIQALFFAGQINGTTGYEEAAAQGLIAGLNAARQCLGLASWTPARDEAYIGVLIDDLCTNGTQEPYRMFTSRAEYRLLLREDNADMRLTAIGRDLGLVDELQWRFFNDKQDKVLELEQKLKKKWVQPKTESAVALSSVLSQELTREYSLHELLKRPELTIDDILNHVEIDEAVRARSDITAQVEVRTKYEGYLNRQQQEILKLKEQQSAIIPENFNYKNVKGLSAELTEKLERVCPQTIGQAQRIPGITPAAISILLVYLKKHKAKLAS